MSRYDYYGVYRSCRNAAWRFLSEMNIDRLPVKLIAAAHHLDIQVKRESDVGILRKGEYGASIYRNGHWIIVYDDTLPAPQSRIVLAHELGHILLGHEYKYADMRFSEKGTGSRKIKCENEADMFAIRLLAPACVLHELGALNADRIESLCLIPHEAALTRAARMRELEQRGKFYADPLESEVRKCFDGFIRTLKNNGY